MTILAKLVVEEEGVCCLLMCLLMPWYTEYIEVILLSFNGHLVQLLECSLIHTQDVSWSWVFNSHTWHHFWQQISWYFPYGSSVESMWTCSMESKVDIPKFHMESSGINVLRSGSVQFFYFQIRQPQPQPVLDQPIYWVDPTGLSRTSPNRLEKTGPDQFFNVKFIIPI